MNSTLYTDPFLKRSNSDPCSKKTRQNCNIISSRSSWSSCLALPLTAAAQKPRALMRVLPQCQVFRCRGRSEPAKLEACVGTSEGKPVENKRQPQLGAFPLSLPHRKLHALASDLLFHCKKQKVVALMLPSESLSISPAFDDETWDSEFKNGPNTRKRPRNQPPRVWASAPPYLGVMTRALRDPMKKHHRGRLAQKSAGNLAAKTMALRGDSLRMIVTLRTIIVYNML